MVDEILRWVYAATLHPFWVIGAAAFGLIAYALVRGYYALKHYDE